MQAKRKTPIKKLRGFAARACRSRRGAAGAACRWQGKDGEYPSFLPEMHITFFFVRAASTYLFLRSACDGVGGLPLSRREAKGPSSTRGGGPVRLLPAPPGRGRDARRACHGRWFSAAGGTHVWRGASECSSCLGCPVFGPLNSIRQMNYFLLNILLGLQ